MSQECHLIFASIYFHGRCNQKLEPNTWKFIITCGWNFDKKIELITLPENLSKLAFRTPNLTFKGILDEISHKVTKNQDLLVKMAKIQSDF